MAGSYNDLWGGPQQQQMNPWMSFAGGVAPGLIGAFGALADSPQKKMMRQQMGRQTDMYGQLRWRSGLGQDVITPQMQQQMLGQYRQSMEPTLASQMWSASRNAGMSSPQTQNMFMRQWMPMMSGYANQLNMANQQMRQSRDADLRSGLLRLAGA